MTSKPWSARKISSRVRTPDEEWADKVADAIDADCHPWQLDASNDPSLRISLLVGRGGGKTTTKRARALKKMARIRRARIVYIATTRGQAEQLNWIPLKDSIEALIARGVVQREDFELLEGKLRCTCLRTGAMYTMVPAEDRRDIEKLRGQPFDEVQIDEGASHDSVLLDHLVKRIIGPRLGERNGAIVIGGTPGHVLNGLFYDVTSPGSKLHRPYRDRDKPEYRNWIGWSSHSWSLADFAEMEDALERYPAIVKNWEAALEEKQREQWSDDNPVWMREYRGMWAADDTENIYRYRAHVDGKKWNQWDPPIDPQTGFAVLPDTFSDWIYGYGCDMGSKDPYALNIFALSPTDPTRTLYHVFCFSKTQMYARLIANLMIGEDAVERVLRNETVDYATVKGGTFAVTGWPAAYVADLAALGEAVINELGAVYGIRIQPAEKRGKFAAIEGVNGDLVDGRIKILKGSDLEKQLESLQWRRDEYEQVKENKGDRNDHTDSLIYIRRELVGLFASGIAVAKDPAHAPVYSDPMDLGGEPQGEFDAMLSDAPEDWGND